MGWPQAAGEGTGKSENILNIQLVWLLLVNGSLVRWDKRTNEIVGHVFHAIFNTLMFIIHPRRRQKQSNPTWIFLANVTIVNSRRLVTEGLRAKFSDSVEYAPFSSLFLFPHHLSPFLLHTP